MSEYHGVKSKCCLQQVCRPKRVGSQYPAASSPCCMTVFNTNTVGRMRFKLWEWYQICLLPMAHVHSRKVVGSSSVELHLHEAQLLGSLLGILLGVELEGAKARHIHIRGLLARLVAYLAQCRSSLSTQHSPIRQNMSMNIATRQSSCAGVCIDSCSSLPAAQSSGFLCVRKLNKLKWTFYI